MTTTKRRIQPAELLPQITRNKKFEKAQKYKEKKAMKELKRENPQAAAKIERVKLKRQLADKRAAAAAPASAKALLAKKKKKKQKAAAAATGVKKSSKKAPAPASLSALDVGKKKKKDRRPKTVIANEKTGRETFAKKQTRELVAERGASEKLIAKMKKEVLREARGRADTAAAAAKMAGKKTKPSAESQSDMDQLLIARAIRGGGDDHFGGGGGGGSSNHHGNGNGSISSRGIRSSSPASGDIGSSLVRRDPSLYPPEVAFYEDYAERKQTQAVSEDVMLKNAHEYFKKVGQQERRLNTSAASFLRRMKEVNLKGGDKDGFRYVVPKNVRSVVKMMKQNEHLASGGTEDDGTFIDEDNLQSTFGGDGTEETSDRPMRSNKKRQSTYHDFYQFQVSKRWTRNAESFLNRGKAHKALFEAKKRQRSIRKL